jgi:muramoyltetrapeptide carboxypeptidase
MILLQKPPRLSKGDTIGIAAPSGAFSEERFARAVAYLRSMGFTVTYRDDITARHRYLAGNLERRATELIELLHDPSINAIFCARGGFGAQQIIPAILERGLPSQSKIVVGYSDITVLHALLHRVGHWPTFYGPTLTRHLEPDGPPENFANILRACGSSEPLGPLAAPELAVIRPGEIEGPLIGGCLTLIHHSIGTPYAWECDGGILFLEDIEEKVYAIERMLTHLLHAGIFDRVKGVVLGSLVPASADTSPENLLPMLTEFFADFRGPVVMGLPAGHCDPSLTLPLGCHAHLTTSPPGLTISEGAVT